MFIKRFEIFRLFGFPIRIDLSWFIVVLLITWSLAAVVFPSWHDGLATGAYWGMGFIAAIGLFVSVLLHELGHALVARRCGMRMNGITLFIFGGVAEMQDEPPSAKDEFLVAIAGPIVSIAMAGVFIALWLVMSFADFAAEVTLVTGWLGWINGILVAFNMIPAFPLDGGRVLRSALWHWKNNLRWATKITSTIGSGFGVLLIVFGVLSLIGGNLIGGIWLFIIGMFLRGAAQMSYQQLLVRRALEGEPVHRFMKTQPTTVEPDLTLDRLVNDYFYRYYHKMYPVMEHGELRGCISTRDVKDVPSEQWSAMTVRDLVKPCSSTNTIRADTDAMETMSRMNRNDASRLMVVDDAGRLVGVIALKDLLRFLAMKVELEEDSDGRRPGSWSQPRGFEPEPVNRMREFEQAGR